MQTPRSSQSRFPAHRAFVVQVAVAELGVPDVPLGRAEHVVSGTAAHFTSWAELVTFIEQVLAAAEKPSNHREQEQGSEGSSSVSGSSTLFPVSYSHTLSIQHPGLQEERV